MLLAAGFLGRGTILRAGEGVGDGGVVCSDLESMDWPDPNNSSDDGGLGAEGVSFRFTTLGPSILVSAFELSDIPNPMLSFLGG